MLTGAYDAIKDDVARVLDQLLRTRQLVVRDRDVVRRALADYRNGATDFADGSDWPDEPGGRLCRDGDLRPGCGRAGRVSSAERIDSPVPHDHRSTASVPPRRDRPESEAVGRPSSSPIARGAPTHAPTCTCGAREFPLLPTRATTCPDRTVSPSSTVMSRTWAYMTVVVPS